MQGIALSWRDLPDELIERENLRDRVVFRNQADEGEIRFLYRDKRPLLPAYYGNQLLIFRWGNRNPKSRLPRTGWCRKEVIEEGHWRCLNPKLVEIPAVLGFDHGVWYQIKEGMQGVLVHNEHKQPHVYMLTEPASHYYHIMTHNDRMPAFVGETF